MTFENKQTKVHAVVRAGNIIGQVRSLYALGKEIQASLALYQADTDPVFNAAVGALFSGAERTELNAMLGDIDTLVTEWETNHAAALGIV